MALAAVLAWSLAGAGAGAAELTFVMRIEHGALPADRRLIRVTQGDVIRLRFSTDRPGELHIHGYDIERKLVPGTVTEVTITARAAGRFPIHLHGAPAPAGSQGDDDLAILEVYPR
jgi:FtsP/CotA-like multicopper oxidase with cupredoxin domain